MSGMFLYCIGFVERPVSFAISKMKCEQNLVWDLFHDGSRKWERELSKKQNRKAGFLGILFLV